MLKKKERKKERKKLSDTCNDDSKVSSIIFWTRRLLFFSLSLSLSLAHTFTLTPFLLETLYE